MGFNIDTTALGRSKYRCHAFAATPPEVGVLFVFVSYQALTRLPIGYRPCRGSMMRLAHARREERLRRSEEATLRWLMKSGQSPP